MQLVTRSHYNIELFVKANPQEETQVGSEIDVQYDMQLDININGYL